LNPRAAKTNQSPTALLAVFAAIGFERVSGRLDPPGISRKIPLKHKNVYARSMGVGRNGGAEGTWHTGDGTGQHFCSPARPEVFKKPPGRFMQNNKLFSGPDRGP